MKRAFVSFAPALSVFLLFFLAPLLEASTLVSGSVVSEDSSKLSAKTRHPCAGLRPAFLLIRRPLYVIHASEKMDA
jgi:hypothetical protein